MFSADTTLAVIGLGQVGLQLARAFAARFRTIGIDRDAQLITRLTTQLTAERSAHARLELTSDFAALSEVDVIFIALPTITNRDGQPDLSALLVGCENIAPYLKRGVTLVFESTVYPGATEELCIPTIEKAAGLSWKSDFSVAYSPERINPGDSEHTLITIPKVVAGDEPETLERVAGLYETIIKAGVHRVSSIKTAEATKIVENAQRDLNIALVNELSVLCHRLGIDTKEVLGAAETKWNFSPYRPGLVGGTCLSLAAEFFSHQAAQVKAPATVVRAGRQANERTVGFVMEELERSLADHGVPLSGARIAVLGCTFKPNVDDCSNSKVLELIRQLAEKKCHVAVHDPHANKSQLPQHDGITYPERNLVGAQADAVVFAVAHDVYLHLPLDVLLQAVPAGAVVMDLTWALDAEQVKALGMRFWRF